VVAQCEKIRACTGKGEARLGMDVKFQGGTALGGIDCIRTVEQPQNN
jgi:hypothetical protein